MTEGTPGGKSVLRVVRVGSINNNPCFFSIPTGNGTVGVGGDKQRRTSSQFSTGFTTASPSSFGLQGGQFVNGGVIPRVQGLKNGKSASPPSRNSLERDLGLGTSGEDESSESSLSKKNKNKSSSKSHIKEMYNNEGYLSDDEDGG
ncbi:unnamed protein product, partial [Allacma fusca]